MQTDLAISHIPNSLSSTTLSLLGLFSLPPRCSMAQKGHVIKPQHQKKKHQKNKKQKKQTNKKKPHKTLSEFLG